MALSLHHLNPNQREAVLHRDGPLLVLAGAGSGKTNTMAHRIAHLVAERKLPPNNILGLSFTNKAAKELKERVVKLIEKSSGKGASKGLVVTTFHSLCARLLRAHAECLGFQKNFSIVDQGDQHDILKQTLKNVHIDDRKFDIQVILFEIGQAKNRFLNREQAEAYFLESGKLSGDYAIAAASSYGHYQDQLKLLNAMDFDDLIFNAVRLFSEHEDLRTYYGTKFRQILVDEYQDTNPAQFKLLRLLTEVHQNLCVVGDDDQSIYGWRGADAQHILQFSHHYSAAQTITLDQNYRSTSTILDAANHVIAVNPMRHPKKLWSDRGVGEPITEVVLEEDRNESEFVAQEILERAKTHQRPWKDFAVLYRSNAQSRLFEEALRRNQIPYKIVGGMSFLDRKEVKDVLCYWRLVMNPKDDASLRRILNWPARGIGKSSIEALGNHAFEQKLPFFEALPEASRLAPRSYAGTMAFRNLILDLRAKLDACAPTPEAVSLWARDSLVAMQARRALEEENEDPVQLARKWENVEELVHSIGQLQFAEGEAPDSPTILREFLSRMALDAKEEEEDKKDEKDKDKNQVTLLTLHGAKGLEFPVVFLVGMEEGYLPHKRTIEGAEDFSEERRLCYVGITRARDLLFLSRVKNRIRYGKPVPRYRCRFLAEVPKELILVRDESFSPDLSDEGARQAHEDKVKGFLAGIRANLMKK